VGGFLFGFDSAVINGAVDAIGYKFHVSSGLVGWLVAIALLGCAVGAWYAGKIADRFGRIPTMKVAGLLFMISSVGTGFAFSAWEFALWRILSGVAIGMASVIAPAYIAEISPAHKRGRLASLQQMAIVIGIFVALLVDALFANVASGPSSGENNTSLANNVLWGLQAWQWMFLACAIPAGVYLYLALRIPESPRYLVQRGMIEQARRVLRRVLPAGEVDPKVVEIQRTLEQPVAYRVRDLKGKMLGLLPIVWVGILLSVFQQFVGINVIFYYSTSLWDSVGFGASAAFWISVVTSVVNILVTIVAIATVDRFGRRPLLLIGSAGMAVALALLTVCFWTANAGAAGTDNNLSLGPVAGPLALVGANLFVVFFGMSWGPVVWVLLGEMFNNRIRAIALAVAAAAQWLANFVVTGTFPTLKAINVALPYLLFTIFAVMSFFFVTKMVRETKGRELEDM
jgi:sugar porter (SP) family MFS transporter